MKNYKLSYNLINVLMYYSETDYRIDNHKPKLINFISAYIELLSSSDLFYDIIDIKNLEDIYDNLEFEIFEYDTNNGRSIIECLTSKFEKTPIDIFNIIKNIKDNIDKKDYVYLSKNDLLNLLADIYHERSTVVDKLKVFYSFPEHLKQQILENININEMAADNIIDKESYQKIKQLDKSIIKDIFKSLIIYSDFDILDVSDFIEYFNLSIDETNEIINSEDIDNITDKLCDNDDLYEFCTEYLEKPISSIKYKAVYDKESNKLTIVERNKTENI